MKEQMSNRKDKLYDFILVILKIVWVCIGICAIYTFLTRHQFAGKEWSREDTSESLKFYYGGRFSYYDDGEPVASSDYFNAYKYNPFIKTITVYDRNDDIDDFSETIIILEMDSDYLKLKMGEKLGGEVREFSIASSGYEDN